MIQLEIPNTPVPWTAARISSRGAFNPRAKERDFTRWQIKSAYRGDVLDGYIVIQLIFAFPIPNSTSKKNKQRMLDGEILPTNCDCTNLQKFYEDCLKNIVIKDDRYVVKITSEKLYRDKGCIFMKIYTLDEYRKINADFNRND